MADDFIEDDFIEDVPGSYVPRAKEIGRKILSSVPATEPLSMLGELYRPAKRIKEGFPRVAGEMAEYLGGKGVNPNVSAALTTPVAIAPEIASSALGVGEVLLGKGPLMQAIRKTPKMLGPEFQAGERAAGISGELPVQRGAAARFPDLSGKLLGQPPPQAPLLAPKSYPKDSSTILNFIKDRVSSLGDKLTPQELDDSKTILTNLIREGKVVRGTKPYAIASEQLKQVTKLHNEAIPGRETLNKIYSLSKTIHPDFGGWVKQGVEKYGVKAIGTVLAGLGIGAGAKLIK